MDKQKFMHFLKYTRYYSGREPEFIERDVFRVVVPLDEDYSFDYKQGNPENEKKGILEDDQRVLEYEDILTNVEVIRERCEKYGKSTGKVREKLNRNQKIVIDYIEVNKKITNKEVQRLLNVKESRALKILRELTQIGVLKKEGKSKGTYYVIMDKDE